MNSSRSNEILNQALDAIQEGDRPRALSLLAGLIRKDEENLVAWRVLHDEFGGEEEFETFRHEFMARIDPDARRPKMDVAESRQKGKSKSLRRATLPRRDYLAQKGAASERGRTASRRINTGPRPKVRKLDPDTGPLRLSVGVPDAQSKPEPEEGPEEKKPGLFARIFKGGRKKEPVSGRAPAGRRLSEIPRVSEPVAEPPPKEKKSTAAKPGPSTPPSGATASAGGLPRPIPQPEPFVLPSSRSLISAVDHGKIKVLVVDDVRQTRENIIRLLKFEGHIQVVGGAESGFEGVRLAVEHQPDVILMDVNMPDMDGIEAAKQVKAKVPLTQIVMLTVQDDPGYMRKAIIAGARDYLIKPPTIDELTRTIEQAYAIGQIERERQQDPEDDIITEGPVRVGRRRSGGDVIAIYGPKGGIGRTSVAVNLAAAMMVDDARVLVIDASLPFGGLSVFFNEQSRTTLADLAPRVAELDPEVVAGIVIQHDSGIHLLAAPKDPDLQAEITDQNLAELLRYLRGLYDYILVDTAAALSDTTLAVLDESDWILLLINQEIPALNNAKRFLDLSALIGLSGEKIFLVLNQYRSQINISPERIAENFRKEVLAVLPYEYATAVPAVNQGLPFNLEPKLKGKPLVREVGKLAEAVKAKIKAREAL
jgi:pilus assembly protein CpaE